MNDDYDRLAQHVAALNAANQRADLAEQRLRQQPVPVVEPYNPLAHSEQWTGSMRYQSDAWLNAQARVIYFVAAVWVGGFIVLAILGTLFSGD